MQRLTIREAMEAEDAGGCEVCPSLYVFRDGDVVFYVGQSAQPFERLQQHLGQSETWVTSPDRLGQLILNNLPASLAWVMEVTTLEEFHAVLPEPVKPDIDSLEQYFISKHKPCLNCTFNKHPTPLPLRYIRDSAIANEGVILE